MSLAGNTPNNNRLLNDYNFVSAKALVAGAGAVAGSFDLVQATPYPTPEQYVLKVDTGAMAGSNTTVSFTVQDSADNSTFANVSALGALTQTVPTTAPATASVASWLLPPTIRQYVRVSASVSASTTGNYTASLSF